MNIEEREGGKEYGASHVDRFLESSFGTPVAKDGSGMPTSWDVSRVKVLVDEVRGVVDIYDLDPTQRVYHPDDEKSGIKVPRYFHSLFSLRSSMEWYCALADGGQSLNCRVPLADFEASL